MLLRGKLLGGALFAGALFGATVPTDVVQAGGFSPAQRAMRQHVSRPVVTEQVVEAVKQQVDIREEDDMILQLIITAVTREIL